MTKIVNQFDIHSLPGDPKCKTALLIAPPVYDTQYWSQWSQPYGLLRIAALLKKHRYKRLELFDFMEVPPGKKIHRHRINVCESYAERFEPERPIMPFIISKPGDPDKLTIFKYHFGKTWSEFEEWLDAQGFTARHPPTEIWISSVMTYWWESVRDLIARLRNRFGDKPVILLGGIYSTLTPQHAAEFTRPNIVVAGEIEEANDLWTDLSLYDISPSYAIITPSRGCPFNCAYCAQKTINNGRSKVHFRPPDDIYNEMLDKWNRYSIRDFAFYADFPLWRFEKNFLPLLERIASNKEAYFRIHAPEGLDVKLLSQSQKLVDLLKAARLQKVYLPCESIDEEYIRTFNRKHVRLEHFIAAVKMCERAGFELRNMDVNAFVLYGLPEETIDRVVKSILFVSEIVGSIIPMLFTPVPTSGIYQEYLSFIKQKGWDRDLHMLNGKLYPFLEINEGSISDYIDLQRLMFMLNAHYRSESFRVLGDSLVASRFRANLNNGFGDFVAECNAFDSTKSNIPQLEKLQK
ncbi:MAG: radical SAM protein [Chloroflexota bacterium]